MPPVAYSFVTKSCPALHTFARAGRRAGTRGETKSQMPHGSCVHEPAGIEGERFGHPVLLSYLRTSNGLEPLPMQPYGVSPVIMRPDDRTKHRDVRSVLSDLVLAPGRGAAVAHRLEDRVTGQRPPRRFDQHMAQATDALAADVAPPNRCPRGVLTGRQASVAKQSPLIGESGHIPQFGR